MLLAPTLLGCLLLGQDPASEATPPSLSPPEMVAMEVVIPPDSGLSGQPVGLAQLLAVSPDSRSRVEVAHAYWRLAAAVARYNARRGKLAFLAALQPRPGEEAPLDTARADAAAGVSEAELDVLATQHDLAQWAGLPPADPLPLPLDPPHVGTYRTGFEEIFAGRPAPMRSRLIDRSLPVHRRLIDQRAEAVRSAAEAVDAAQEAYRSGRSDLARCAAAAAELAQQREAFFGAVCHYNHEIADYVALAVDRPLSPAAFAARLIRSPGDSNPPLMASRPEEDPPWRQPTLAPSRESVRPTADLQPLAPAEGTPPAGRPATPPTPQQPPPAGPEAPKLPVVPVLETK